MHKNEERSNLKYLKVCTFAPFPAIAIICSSQKTRHTHLTSLSVSVNNQVNSQKVPEDELALLRTILPGLIAMIMIMIIITAVWESAENTMLPGCVLLRKSIRNALQGGIWNMDRPKLFSLHSNTCQSHLFSALRKEKREIKMTHVIYELSLE